MAGKRNISSTSGESQVGQFGDDIEFPSFMFDPGQNDNPPARHERSSDPTSSAPIGGHFSDAEMEFEPFMFNQGEADSIASGHQPVEAQPSGFSFEPFGQPSAVSEAGGPVSEPLHTEPIGEGDLIVGSTLPLPSYLAGEDRGSTSSPESAQLSTPLYVRSQDEAPAPAPAPAASSGSLTGSARLADNEPGWESPRTPSAPLTASTYQPSSPITSGLGRARGNTGPLGPLPPDRATAPNASWSDSSLASIEDFSSILIAMQAGKKLRQSGPLSESMIPSVPEMQAQAPTAVAAQAPVPDTVVTPEAVGMEAGSGALPQWAVQAAQTVAPVSTPSLPPLPEMPEMPEMPSAIEAEQAAILTTEPEAPLMEAQVETQEWAPATTAREEEAPAMEQWQEAEQPSVEMEAAAQAYGEAVAVSEPELAAPEAEPAQPPVAASDTMLPRSSRASAVEVAMAELSALRESPEAATLGGLDPEVAAALRNVDQQITGHGLSGEEIEFENFMWNEGTARPLAAIEAPSHEELEALARDMGPAFDPAPYVPVDEDEAGAEQEYHEVDPRFLEESEGTPPAPHFAPPAATMESHAAEEGGGTELPFWLRLGQETTPAPAPEEPRYVPSEWVGTAPASQGTGAVPPAQSASEQMEEFAELPPFEPFDFSALPVAEHEEILGFNTGELSGLVPEDHDPMTATLNLDAVADLIGGDVSAEPEYAPSIGDELGATSVELESRLSSEPLTWQDSATSGMGMGMGMHAEPPAWASDGSQPETATAAALDAYETPEWEGAAGATAEMDSPTSYALEEPQAPSAMEMEPAHALPEMPPYELEAGSAEMPASEVGATMGAETEAEAGADEPSYPQMDVMPEPMHQPAEWHATGGWMASATTELTGLGLTGGLETANGAMQEADLGIEGLDVAPFDYTQIESHDDEPPTGFLTGEQVRSYGTAQLEMPDTEGALEAMPVDEVWREADGDSSLFVTAPVTPEEVEEAREDHVEAGMGIPMDAEVELEEEGGPTGYLREGAAHMEEGLAGSEGAESEMEEASPEEPLYKVRVARGPWLTFGDAQAQAQATDQSHDMEAEPAVEIGGQPRFADTVEADLVAPAMAASAEALVESEPAYSEREIASPEGERVVHFEEDYKPAIRGDITTTGPLPPLAGFEDMASWIEENPHDIGAHMALAVAYTQAGNYDAALRVYKRIVRKQHVSDMVLTMVGDDLEDLEEQAKHLPRYYQVRGDLLLRLGNHREAVELYRKLQ